ncbi:MAG: hypothetical protein MZV63_53105 [Marinilabiliales bacterium]|nr:hypothetical protein [Marinilabiliales bacterium]
MRVALSTRGTFAAGVSFISYGSFTEADIAGNITGTFTAAEYAFNIIWSYRIDTSFTVGINIKPVLSNLERYFSAGHLCRYRCRHIITRGFCSMPDSSSGTRVSS